MSSSESEKEADANHQTNELKFIADELAENPEIFGKSQLPALKRKKDAAIRQVCQKYAQFFGKTMEPAQLMKKINNMKTRLKKKTDMKKTGNKRIKLLEWEKIMYKAMECDINPTAAKIPGAKSCGVTDVDANKATSEEIASSSIGTGSGPALGQVGQVRSGQPLLVTPKTALLEKSETEETKGLSNTQLQRLVLLEQLKTAKLQGEYFRQKLQRLEQDPGQQNIVMEGENTYLKL